jgi:hypothetical protein
LYDSCILNVPLSAILPRQAAEKPLKIGFRLYSLPFDVSSGNFQPFSRYRKALTRPWTDSGEVHPFASGRGNRIKFQAASLT